MLIWRFRWKLIREPIALGSDKLLDAESHDLDVAFPLFWKLVPNCVPNLRDAMLNRS
jgi:hypothetical protein